jgi:hypothetical protein
MRISCQFLQDVKLDWHKSDTFPNKFTNLVLLWYPRKSGILDIQKRVDSSSFEAGLIDSKKGAAHQKICSIV